MKQALNKSLLNERMNEVAALLPIRSVALLSSASRASALCPGSLQAFSVWP